MTAAHPAPARRRRTGWLLLTGYGAAAAAVAAYTIGVVSPTFTFTGTGAVAVAVAVGHVTAAISGAVCLGGLVLILVTAQPDDRGVLDPATFRAHLVVERLSVLWFVAAATMVVVQAAADAGVPAMRLLGSDRLPAALGASEAGRAWVVAALFAAILAGFSRLTVRWEWHVPLLIPAIVATVAVPVTGNAGQGPNHDYTTSSVIVFALAVSIWAGLQITGALCPPEAALRRRVVITRLAAGVVALLYGIVLLMLRVGLQNLTSAYGWLAIGAAVAILGGVIADSYVLQTGVLQTGRTSSGLAGAAAAVATLSALTLTAVQTSPLLLSAQPTVWDVLLGYELPGSPTALRLLAF